jgi:hypothetical protein
VRHIIEQTGNCLAKRACREVAVAAGVKVCQANGEQIIDDCLGLCGIVKQKPPEPGKTGLVAMPGVDPKPGQLGDIVRNETDWQVDGDRKALLCCQRLMENEPDFPVAAASNQKFNEYPPAGRRSCGCGQTLDLPCLPDQGG